MGIGSSRLDTAWALLNLSAEHRLRIVNIQVAFICLSSVFSKYATEIISGGKDANGNWQYDSSYGGSMRRFKVGVMPPSLKGLHPICDDRQV